jgi:hypothetical protein
VKKAELRLCLFFMPPPIGAFRIDRKKSAPYFPPGRFSADL